MFFIFWIFRRTAKRRKRKPVTEKRPNLLFLWLRMYPRGFSFLKASGKRGEEGCSRTFPPLFIRLLASGSSSRQKQISINLILKNIKKKSPTCCYNWNILRGYTQRKRIHTQQVRHKDWIGLEQRISWWKSNHHPKNGILLPLASQVPSLSFFALPYPWILFLKVFLSYCRLLSGGGGRRLKFSRQRHLRADQIWASWRKGTQNI